MPMRRVLRSFAALVCLLATLAALAAQANGPVPAGHESTVTRLEVAGREVELVIPPSAPAPGARALLVVLHGGLGNARHVRASLQMDPMAEKYGFLIAYLNGYPSPMNERMKTWNAGTCCGPAQRMGSDDLGYIVAATQAIAARHGVRPDHIVGLGHSNGAMMTQRVMCESGLYQAAVAVAGSLELAVDTCPAARGRRILAIHGMADENVPIGGGYGKGLAGVPFRSAADSERIFERSGAFYRLWLVPGVAHMPQSLREAIARAGGSMQEDIVSFLGLARADR